MTLSPNNWFTIVTALIGIIGSIGAYQSERLIEAVDNQGVQQAADHQDLANQKELIVSLGQGQQALVTRANDHEIRITKLENNPMLDPVKLTTLMNRAEARKGRH